jgi:hypothetical protein
VVLLRLRRVLGMQGRLPEVGDFDSSTVEVDRSVPGIDIGTRSEGLVPAERHYIPSRTNELVDATPSQRKCGEECTYGIIQA